jgi:hypothetical protein
MASVAFALEPHLQERDCTRHPPAGRWTRIWWSVNWVRREGSWTLGMWQDVQSAAGLTGQTGGPGLGAVAFGV